MKVFLFIIAMMLLIGCQATVNNNAIIGFTTQRIYCPDFESGRDINTELTVSVPKDIKPALDLTIPMVP